MKEKLQMVYRCEHCDKFYLSRAWCAKHEARCKKNPDNDRPCFSCIYMTMKDYEFEDADPQSSVTWTQALYYCEKQSMFLYPPWITTPHELVEYGNAPMQRDCEYKRRLHINNTEIDEWG